MCRAGGSVSCEVVRDQKQLMELRGSSSHHGDTFGLPVVELGGLQVSQSVAGTIFAGEALGHSRSVPNAPKAMQFMLDMRDFIDNIHFGNAGYDGSSSSGKKDESKGPAPAFEHICASGRFDQFFGHFERSIVGPFFFAGAAPSYVDFYFASMMRWVGHQLEVAKSERAWPGELLQAYPKVRGVLSALERV